MTNYDEIRCSICGAPLSGPVCEYCGTKAKGWNKRRRHMDSEQAFAQEARDWDFQAEPEAETRHWERRARRDSRGRFDRSSSSDGEVSTRSKWVAFMLCLFLGRFGVHRLYVGKVGSGLLFMATRGFHWLGVGWDLFSILGGTFTDDKGRPLKR